MTAMVMKSWRGSRQCPQEGKGDSARRAIMWRPGTGKRGLVQEIPATLRDS